MGFCTARRAWNCLGDPATVIPHAAPRGHSTARTERDQDRPSIAAGCLRAVLALKIWLEEQLARVSAKPVIAEAIRYGLNHWDGLVRFLEDGRIELDTNIVKLFSGG